MGFTGVPMANGTNVIIGRVGERCGAVHYVKGPCWITDNALVVRETRDGLDRKFLALLLDQLNLNRLRAKGGQPLISQGPIYALEVSLPPPNEQRVIVSILDRWERLIGLIEGLIAAKKQFRKWLMQQLLTGKRRLPGFSDQWRTVHVREIIEPVSRRVPKPPRAYTALGIRSHCKGTFSRVVAQPDTVAMNELYVARADDLIVNITFAWEGAIAIVPAEHDGHLVSHRFPTFRAKPDRVHLDYLRYLVRQQRFIFLLGLISPGGAGRNRVLNKRDFLELRVSLPTLPEQEKIASVLRLADAEIARLTELLEALREQKKGLMQQLLTGKRRVKCSQ
jgi:type I restriction enzyme S subunit